MSDHVKNEWIDAFKRWRELCETDRSTPESLDETVKCLEKIYEAFMIAQKMKEIVIVVSKEK